MGDWSRDRWAVWHRSLADCPTLRIRKKRKKQRGGIEGKEVKGGGRQTGCLVDLRPEKVSSKHCGYLRTVNESMCCSPSTSPRWMFGQLGPSYAVL